MGTTDSNGIYFYEDTDAVSPLHTLLNLGQTSVTNALDATARIWPIANTAARTALVAAHPPTASEPLYAHRADAPEGQRLEVTIDGTTWTPVNNSGLVAVTGGAITGTAPPVGTLLKEVTVFATFNSSTAGRNVVNFGYTFPNGVVYISPPALLNGDTYVGAYLNYYGNPTLSSVTIQIVGSGGTPVPSINPRVSFTVKGW